MQISLSDDELSLLVAVCAATAQNLQRAALRDDDPDFDVESARVEAIALADLSHRLAHAALHA